MYNILEKLIVMSLALIVSGRVYGQSPSGLTNLGMVGVRNVDGAYLQAHYPDGEMHSSNQHRNEEETWFLFEVDKANHVYALMNWRNGKFMSKRGDCVPADSTALGDVAKFTFVSGKKWGVLNAVAMRSNVDKSYVWGDHAGHDTPCGGEVECRRTDDPSGDTHWIGWWVLEPANAPSPGKDFWNTVGGAVQGAVNKISAADVAAVIAAIAGG